MTLKRLLATATLALAFCLPGCGGGGSDEPATPTVPQPALETLDLVSYGLEIRDAEGRLIASERAPALHYLGTATYVSTSGYYHTFTASSPGGPPLPVIEVTPGGGQTYKMLAVTSQGNSVYQFTVMSSEGASTKIHLFAPLTAGAAPAEAWGTRVMGPSTDPRPYFDSTLKPLVLDGFVSLPEANLTAMSSVLSSTGFTPPTLTRLGVVARAEGLMRLVAATNGSAFQEYAVLLRVETGAIQRVLGPVVATSGPGGYSYVTPVGGVNDENVFLIDLNRYLP